MTISNIFSRQIEEAKMNYRLGQEYGERYGVKEGTRMALKKIFRNRAKGHLEAAARLMENCAYFHAYFRLSFAMVNLRFAGLSEMAKVVDQCMTHVLRGKISNAQYQASTIIRLI